MSLICWLLQFFKHSGRLLDRILYLTLIKNKTTPRLCDYLIYSYLSNRLTLMALASKQDVVGPGIKYYGFLGKIFFQNGNIVLTVA